MIVLLLTALAVVAQGFYLPGVIPKSYSYNEILPISMSSQITADKPASYNSKTGQKFEVHLARDTLKEYDFCNPDDGFLLEKT